MSIDDNDNSESLLAQIREAIEQKQKLRIQGGGSKTWLNDASGLETYDILSLANHTGIVDYEPAELVLRARAGTPLKAIETVLADSGQMLAFEPPQHTVNATLGGAIACGLSGPARPYRGSARDFVLGTTLVNGKAELLNFGGNVMKNVAGYDVSRLQAGAMGTLGVMLEVALKVLPRPTFELTLSQAVSSERDLSAINRLHLTTLPVSASAIHDNQRWIRLSGTEPAVKLAQRELGGDVVDNGADFWQSLNNHTHAFFNAHARSNDNLWRIAVPHGAAVLPIKGRWLYEWGGAQRWLWSDASADSVFKICAQAGGHARCYRPAASAAAQAPRRQAQPAINVAIQQRLRRAFDPHGLFDIGQFELRTSTEGSD